MANIVHWEGEAVDLDRLAENPIYAGRNMRAALTGQDISLAEAEALCPTEEEVEEAINSLTAYEKLQLKRYAEFLRNVRWLKEHYN